MTRIERRFAELKREGRAGLVTFITAGDPDYDTSLAILKALPDAGADVIELGMPFSDPMADGPAIQASSQRALKSSQSMQKTLAMVRAFRAADATTPIVLMGYYNPIYPADRFIADASAGVDGLIVSTCRQRKMPSSSRRHRGGLNFIRPPRRDGRAPASRRARQHIRSPLRFDRRDHAAPDIAVSPCRRIAHTDLPIAVGFRAKRKSR
jgi:tryptophan synthase alpha chain